MRHIVYSVAFLLLLCTFPTVRAGEIHFLPEPQQVKLSGEQFDMKRVRLVSSVLVPQLEAWVTEAGGTADECASSVIEIRLVEKLEGIPLNENEAYRLTVHRNKIRVEAITEQGAYWGLQTLNQLLQHRRGKTFVRGCEIVDWPAFRVRGFMQDVGRGYISMDELKREIDMLSRYKINVFHWHLTENQAWRLESKLFPVLNDSCNVTRMPGKFYTQEEAKELVRYCKQRQVLLIPEFDMPVCLFLRIIVLCQLLNGVCVFHMFCLIFLVRRTHMIPIMASGSEAEV